MPDDFTLTDDTRASLHRWLRTWNTPDLAAKARIELSPRLTRSLGRCYPDRRLIRIAARELHGPRIRLRQGFGGTSPPPCAGRVLNRTTKPAIVGMYADRSGT